MPFVPHSEPEFTKPPMASNRYTGGHKTTVEKELDSAYKPWRELLQPAGDETNTKRWKLKPSLDFELPTPPSPNDEVFLNGATNSITAGGNTVLLNCEYAEPLLAQDEDGNEIITRVRTVGKSRTGEPIYSQFFIPAWKFALVAEPVGSWLPNWSEVRETLMPQILRERELDEAQAEVLRQDEKRLNDLHASKKDPSGSLGAAIAAGVAAALKNMNAKPGKAGAA